VPSLRTAGGHRRFDAEEIERLRGRLSSEADALTRWTDRLLADRDHALTAALLLEHERRGAWYAVADALGPVLDELGRRWQGGEVRVLEEHDASQRLTRALARCAESLVGRRDAPRIVLATAEGDEHTLGLSLAELCVRDRGWRAIWGGRATPCSELVRTVEAGEVEVVALSASIVSDAAALAREVELLAPACTARGVALIAGGKGPWPARPDLELQGSFAALDAWMRRFEAARAEPPAAKGERDEPGGGIPPVSRSAS
jgi:MerR family transcriptional regulator, light-induced transcriptional regulator